MCPYATAGPVLTSPFLHIQPKHPIHPTQDVVTSSIRALQPPVPEQGSSVHKHHQQQPAPLILEAEAIAPMPPPMHTPHPRESYDSQGLSALAEEARGA